MTFYKINVCYNNAESKIAGNKSICHDKKIENASASKNFAVRKCRARYGLDRKYEWCRACCQKKKCTRYKNDEKEDPKSVVSPEITTKYPVHNIYRPYMPLVNVMLGY